MLKTGRLTRPSNGWHKRAMVERRRPRRAAVPVAAIAMLAALLACAGSGKRYACDEDAGPCSHPNTDGGHPDLPPFLGAPVVVAHDGQHDGFGDVIRYAGQAYVAYRRATYRGYDGTAQVQIARSGDRGLTWAPVSTLALPGFDLRDPKLAVFKDRLVVSFTAWDVKDPTQNRTFVRFALSDDGAAFATLDPPSLPQPFGLAAWRPRIVDGALLLPVWVADELLQHPELNHVSLLRSTDGQSFGVASTLPIGGGGTEPELLVQAGGKMLVTAPERAVLGQPQRQSFCRSTASAAGLSDWTCWTSNVHVESPALYDWKGIVLLAGRHDIGDGHKRTGLWQVIEEEKSVQLLAELDSAGDTGALGFVALDDNTALLSYYSTSRLDPRVASLGHEPTEVESIRNAFAVDVLALQLSLSSLPISR